jgi:hypothetical protein
MRARILVGAAAACAAALAVPLAPGCGGSLDCTEKATCADPGDASLVDTVAVDVHGGQDADSSAVHDTSAPPDAPLTDTAPHDAVYDVPFDSFVLPEGGDVVVPDGCTTAGENCTNGIDDNCNGLVDCADPLCFTGYVCDDVVPGGWQGPIELYLGSGSPLPSPPSCAAPYINDLVDGNEGLNVPPAQCSCTCGPVSGADCSGAGDWYAYSSTNCQNQCDTKAMPSGNGTLCQSASGCAGAAASFQIIAGLPSLGSASCQPNGATTLPPTSWQQVARGCGYSGPVDTGGCDAGGHCVARPASPFGTKSCIYATNDQACPGGSSYSSKQLLYTSVSEGRGCTQCTCGSPSGVGCFMTGSLSMYAFNNPSCSDNTGTAMPGGGCINLVGVGAAVMGLTTTVPEGGSCQPVVSDPNGTATPQGPITVCCQP